MERDHHLRFLTPHAHLASPFGASTFGAIAEKFARIFGTPQFLIAQTLVVVGWIAINAVALTHFDPYPFILLNLAFSTQAAYAAPLILLAETRQADRDKDWSAADAQHREELASTTLTLLEQNTRLTEEVKRLSEQIQSLTVQIHGSVTRPASSN
ncbi:MAG: DUF1003 domain-containing protein [Dehalococcoidia bacterium]